MVLLDLGLDAPGLSRVVDYPNLPGMYQYLNISFVFSSAHSGPHANLPYPVSRPE